MDTHGNYTINGRSITYINPDPAVVKEVNGVKFERVTSFCRAILERGDISAGRKPGIWQVLYYPPKLRVREHCMVHYTCPWCSKIGTASLGDKGECTLCERCFRHYFVYFNGWRGYIEEFEQAKDQFEAERRTDHVQ